MSKYASRSYENSKKKSEMKKKKEKLRKKKRKNLTEVMVNQNHLLKISLMI